MISSLLGALFMPAISLVLPFLFADFTGSYAKAGVLSAAVTFGMTIAGPVRGRVVDRRPAPKVVLAVAALYATGMSLILVVTRSGMVPSSLWWTIVPLALASGFVTPPILQVTRSTWPRMMRGPEREAAYAVESTLTELLFVIAPMVAAFVVAGWGPSTAMAACASAALLGPALFAWALWRAGMGEAVVPRENPASAGDPLWRRPGFLRLLVFGALLVAGLMSVDLVLVAWARDRGTPSLAGVLAAVWAIGSLSGGLVAGGLTRPPKLYSRAFFAASGLLALTLVLPPVANPALPWLVCGILFVGGTAIAPTLAANNSIVADVAPSHRRAEAFGWWSSAANGGAAVAAPAVGALLDMTGPAAAAALAGSLVLVGAVLVTHHSVRVSPPAAVAEQTVST